MLRTTRALGSTGTTTTPTTATRVLTALGAVVALLASLVLVAPSAQASVIPHHGTYSGVDHHGQSVSFSFAGTQMAHFTVSHHVIGGAHVSNAMWHETCHNGYCTKGQWTAPGHVSGYWRHGSGSWVHFTATFQQPSHYVGPYMGRDSHDLRIHFWFGSGRVTAFSVDGVSYGDFAVSSGRFSGCQHGICVQGHSQDNYYVVGHWRPHSSSHWINWTANAYAT